MYMLTLSTHLESGLDQTACVMSVWILMYVRVHSMLVITLSVLYSLEQFGGRPVEQKEQTIVFTEGSQSFAESKLFTCTYVCMFFIVVVSDCICYYAN